MSVFGNGPNSMIDKGELRAQMTLKRLTHHLPEPQFNSFPIYDT